MSFSHLFSTLGGAIGSSFGGGIFSSIGRFGGSLIGKYLDEVAFIPDENVNYQKQLESLFPTLNTLNKPIALVFGKSKALGHLIWSLPFEEIEDSHANIKYFSFSGRKKSINKQISYSYYASFALGICTGQIDSIGRVWAGDQLIDLSCYKHRLYKGSNMQEADRLIVKDKGKHACAFRDLAYIVFEDFPLQEFGNKIPPLAFEVIKKASSSVVSVEDMLKSVIMIPGSGEFIYDTQVQYKTYKIASDMVSKTQIINSHNQRKIVDSIESLDLLLSVCPNLESIGLVVCQFADSLDIADCKIFPAVEYKDPGIQFSQQWRVGELGRENARLIGRQDGMPRYGGTVNDASLVRFIKELKARKLKVMLYPLIFMDLEGKPWRGKIGGSHKDVANFFNKPQGYNNFILHYANLTKDLVDSFLIGSELKNITAIKDDNNNFPAVDELVKLAVKVKDIMGSNVAISYAADWSEYHHTDGGWFHLDRLWACHAIDFVGIDVYVPLTENSGWQISDQEILSGWSSGQGYDYYLDAEQRRNPLGLDYAWKNFHHWWSNTHTNPDGSKTCWQPKMKKIWFTEFGYPSIDKATNQPNVFFDPCCVDGGAPVHSNAQADNAIQRKAIKTLLEYWSGSDMVEDMYLWTWDARPYPAWPSYGIWSDEYLWEKGHWINNKFGISNLASIISNLCELCGIKADKIDVSSLDINIEGVIFNKHISAMEAINLLRCCYFFDIYDSAGILCFRKRGQGKSSKISWQDCVKLSPEASNGAFYQKTDVGVLGQINISFLNQSKEYALDSQHINIDLPGASGNIKFLHLPMSMQESQASEVAQMIINNGRVENSLFSFALPLKYLYLAPSDLIELRIDNSDLLLRITQIQMQAMILKISAVLEDVKIYRTLSQSYQQINQPQEPYQDVAFLSLPLLPWLDQGVKQQEQNYVHIAYSSNRNGVLYASIDNQNFDQLATLKGNSAIGVLASFDDNVQANCYLLDERSKFIIYCQQPLTIAGMYADFAKSSFALIGGEIVSIGKVQALGDDMYEISMLQRGQLQTQDFIGSHKAGEQFVMIGQHLCSIPIEQSLLGRNLYWRINSHNYSSQTTSAKPCSNYDDWIREPTISL